MLDAIVVDDEKPARDELKFLLSEIGDVEVVAEAANVAEAIESLQKYPCDVMFLDINMPDATGIDLASALRSLHFPPVVVFVTAYSEYACEAFEVKAADYLLKPVEIDRLKEAIGEVEKQVAEQAKTRKGKQIACKKSGKTFMINASDIIACTAREDYAYVDAKDGQYFSVNSLSKIEKQLGGLGFMRVHRKYLVNLNWVDEVEKDDKGAMTLKIKDSDIEIPVSRRKAPVIKKALQS